MSDNVPEGMKPDDPVRINYLDILLLHLKSYSGSIVKILELGCGAGVPATKHLLDVKEPVIHVTGNDLSTSQLDLARKNLSGYEDRLALVEGDMLALSFPDCSFDAVTGFYSIIHLPREEQSQLVRKIAAWLRPGGLLLANFAVDESRATIMERWLNEEKGWMYWSSWGEAGSVKMLEDAGLEILFRETKLITGDANFVWLLAKQKNATQAA
ncbi:hypothetical protein E8E11_000975 [Didymella keratinophila]|nr:hypothetical protein E8E11_000975 [Didymella keratinophila]